jgi:DNA repair protein SbcC/Rad50
VRIRELSLRNYRVFEEVDLELPARVVGIFGTNGAGKSTLVEAIRFACYGEGRTDKKQIRTHGVLTDCAVRVVFEHGGQQYELRRRIKGRNHQAEAELRVGGAELAVGVTEVNQEIQGLLGMDQKVFRASVFAEQKQLDAFSDVRPGERKQMVLRLLGIRPVDLARAAARKEGRDRKADADRLHARLPDPAEQERERERVRTTAAEARSRADAAAAALAEATARGEEAGSAFERSDRVRQHAEKLAVEREGLERRAEHAEERTATLQGRINALRADVASLPEIEEEHQRLSGASARLAAAERAAEVAGEIEALEDRLGALPPVDASAALAGLERARSEREAARDAASRAAADRDRAVTVLAEAREALDRAADADPTQPCPTCGRPLGEDFAEYVSHCRDRAAAAEEALGLAEGVVREAEPALEEAEARLKEATGLGESARRAAEERSGIEDRLAERRAKLAEVAEPFEGALPDLEALRAEAASERDLGHRLAELRAEGKRLSEAEGDLERAGAELAGCRSRLSELDREVAGLAFDPEDHERIRKERDEAVALLHQARTEEREAADAASAAEAAVRTIEARMEEVREMAATVGGLREDARYLDRVTTLLDGFRDHLVGRIGPGLSREAEALFREVTNREYDDLRINPETLAIEIADGTEYFPMERFSGSETDLANLALRVAISRHLSSMSGTDVGLLVLDEVLGSLDVERKDLFVRAMGRLAGHFHQLFVITHSEQVKDQFQAVVEVRKTGRRRSEAVLL